MRQRRDLNKALILETALAAIDAGGIEALSMRRIATDLDVTPMALYRHVASRDDLVESLVDHALETLTLDSSAGSWDEQLRLVFTQVHRILLAHPALTQILSAQPTAATRAMRAAEVLLESLRSAGFDADEAIAAVAAVESYTFGFTIQQRARSAADQRAHRANLEALPRSEYPRLHELARDFSAWTSEQHFHIGLEWLLAGIRASRPG